MNGKGDKRRPFDRKRWSEGYDRAFGCDETDDICSDGPMMAAVAKSEQDIACGRVMDADHVFSDVMLDDEGERRTWRETTLGKGPWHV